MASGSASPDSTLFLQAESFYRYRFDWPATAARSYLAQALATTLEFAPLVAMASQNGMLDLRLRTYDGAAQLYEAMLSRYPTSRLRPLALYRLGWAYRCASAEGFSGTTDRAFKGIMADPTAGDLGPLAAEAVRVPWKSQDKAIAWSIIPGAGQIYTGKTWNGIGRLTIALAFTSAIVVPAVIVARNRALDWKSVTVATVGIVGLQVTYTTAYQAAQRDALDFNERQEAAFEDAHPNAP
jgi:TM2 domain-containing membrane protein YozV